MKHCSLSIGDGVGTAFSPGLWCFDHEHGFTWNIFFTCNIFFRWNIFLPGTRRMGDHVDQWDTGVAPDSLRATNFAVL